MHSADTLYRSDFFPGLGWMLTKSTWDELSPKWPKAYPFSFVVILFCRSDFCNTILHQNCQCDFDVSFLNKTSLTGMTG